MSTNTPGKKFYKEDHMIVIAERYEKAAKYVEDIITDVKNAQAIFEEPDGCYMGMASGIPVESIEKFIQHLNYLMFACEEAKKYVEYSWEKFSKTDKKTR